MLHVLRQSRVWIVACYRAHVLCKAIHWECLDSQGRQPHELRAETPLSPGLVGSSPSRGQHSGHGVPCDQIHTVDEVVHGVLERMVADDALLELRNFKYRPYPEQESRTVPY